MSLAWAVLGVLLVISSASAQYIEGKAGVISTFLGTSNGGRPCYFPFVYQGKVISYCTSLNHDKPWCATTANYDTDRQWGNCEETTNDQIRAANSNGGSGFCVFPFIYQGQSQSECIPQANARPWCATTDNYDRDQQRGECVIYTVNDIQTFAGNAGGKACAFPFFYQGAYRFDCVTTNYFRRWCATTQNYDADKEWGVCVEPSSKMDTKVGYGNAGGQSCVFPFIYKGVKYTGCILNDNPKLWCATTDNYDRDGRWGRCLMGGYNVLTYGGSGTGNPACYIPYIFQGVQYWGCITGDGRGTPWCGLKANYDTTDAWGYCSLVTKTVWTFGGNDGGNPCIFPYKYKNRIYYNCVWQDTVDAWCATTSDYDADGKWAFCYNYGE